MQLLLHSYYKYTCMLNFPVFSLVQSIPETYNCIKYPAHPDGPTDVLLHSKYHHQVLWLFIPD